MATSPTRAEGIAIAEPARAKQIVDCVRQSRGEVVSVTEAAIEEAWHSLAEAGWYVEPTSASAVAALSAMRQPPGDLCIVPLTGHGLKAAK